MLSRVGCRRLLILLCYFIWMSDIFIHWMRREKTNQWHPPCSVLLRKEASRPAGPEYLMHWLCTTLVTHAPKRPNFLVTYLWFLWIIESLPRFQPMYTICSLSFSLLQATLSTLLHQERDNNLLSASTDQPTNKALNTTVEPFRFLDSDLDSPTTSDALLKRCKELWTKAFKIYWIKK